MTIYYATVNKKFEYVKVYRIVKKVNENTNSISRLMQKLVDKYLYKKAL
ncbi:MAG: hypothetical protein ACP5MK_00370 [Candidatus Micrarchaeia archaeon]